MYYNIKTSDELTHVQQILINSSKIAYDTETTGLKWYRSKVFLHSFSNGEDNFVIRVANFNKSVLENFLRSILEDKNKLIIGQNIKFDRHHLRHTHGIEILGQICDTMLMSHLMDENTTTSLKPRCKAVLGIAMDEKEAVDGWLKENIGANKEKWDFSLVPEHIMDPYAGNDPWLCIKLYDHYLPSIEKHFRQLYETDMKVFDILYKMEKNGLPVDLPYLKSFQAILEERIEKNKKENIFFNFGAEFDVDSPMEVAEVLYKKMKFPVPKLTDKGVNSTDDEALGQIDHPVPKGIQQHRSMSKLLTTYVISLQEQAVNGLVHPDYSLTRTRTGRLSCSDPNAQNLAKNDELRRAFTVDPGEEMWFWDQSQIEMVGFAMYSKDSKMINAIKTGVDLHAMTAAEVLNKPVDQITKEERAMGKGTNFAMIYGVGKAKLARYLSEYVGRKIEDTEAAGFKGKYLNAFPMVYAFQRQVMSVIQMYREPWGHFVKNKFGRVRRIESQKAYTGVNHLIQGWAADMMKAAMVKIEEKFHPKWVQNIHDAIRLDLPVNTTVEIARDIGKLLTDFPEVELPIKYTMERSQTNWAEVKEVR